MCAATAEYGWLLTRGYAATAALKLVGDRHGLRQRQRMAVRRSACSDQALGERCDRALSLSGLVDRHLAVDGFNCLITAECALTGGLVIRGRDRAFRDLASVHGTYRKVKKTPAAIAAIGGILERSGPAGVTWYLDRPVSNSGRLRATLSEAADEHGWPWQVELVAQPDRVLAEHRSVIATSDSWILDRCRAWVDLPGAVVAATPEAWCLDLAEEEATT